MSILFTKPSLLAGKYDFKIFSGSHTLMHQIHIQKIAADIDYAYVLRELKSFLSTAIARPASKCGDGTDRGSWEEMLTTRTGLEFPYRVPGLFQEHNSGGIQVEANSQGASSLLSCQRGVPFNMQPAKTLSISLSCSLTPVLLLLTSFTTSHAEERLDRS